MATEVLVAPRALPTAPLMEWVTMTQRPHVELGGVLVDQVDLTAATQRVAEFLNSDEPHQVVTVNLDFVSIASWNAEFRRVLNAADLAVADGMPLVWLSKLKNVPLAERVAGV